LKKQHLILFLSLLFSGFILPENELTDLERQRLKGSVRSVMETKYTLADKTANASKDKILSQKYTVFDKNGYEVENTIYQSGEEFLKSTFTFGPDGRPSGMHQIKADGTPNLDVIYEYDKKWNIAKAHYNWSEEHNIGEIGEETDYFYEIVRNELFTSIDYTSEYRGYTTGEKYLKPDSNVSFTIINKYDPRGNRLETAYFHSSGRLSWMTKFTYDRYDNLTESRVFKSNRIAVSSKYKHQFDDIGNWVVRREEREVQVNIFTEGLEQADMLTERIIEYY
jgi:hypothetical protein